LLKLLEERFLLIGISKLSIFAKLYNFIVGFK